MQKLAYRVLYKRLGEYLSSLVKGLTKVSRKEVVEVTTSFLGHLSIKFIGKTLLVHLYLHQVRYWQISKELVVVCLKKNWIKHKNSFLQVGLLLEYCIISLIVSIGFSLHFVKNFWLIYYQMMMSLEQCDSSLQ